MKIIIEVSSGLVHGVYYEREAGPLAVNPGVPGVFVVDLDGASLGGETRAEEIVCEPLKDASDIVIEAMHPEGIP